MQAGLAISNLPSTSIGLESTSFGQETHINGYFQYNLCNEHQSHDRCNYVIIFVIRRKVRNETFQSEFHDC